MHNSKIRKISTKKTNARDGTKMGFFDSFVEFMKLEDDWTNESYETDKYEKMGRTLLRISLITAIILSVTPIILAIVHNLISNKLAL